MSELFVGLMSGTSQDGLDAALVELDDRDCVLRAATTTPFPATIAGPLARIVEQARAELLDLGQLHTSFGEFAADCVRQLLSESSVAASEVNAIGFSGHTLYHHPDPPAAFTSQLGNANVVAARTGITTVADFRGMDIAVGGQGAPLLPAFHAWYFNERTETRIIVNIGGIANLTCLVPGEPVIGFDSGPGNVLMDAWCRKHDRGPFDVDGAWASSGAVDTGLLRKMKADHYFDRPPPKSTGLEHFNLDWLYRVAAPDACPTADVQASLLELTATTITESAIRNIENPKRLIVCGGGSYNAALLDRVRKLLPTVIIESTAAYGIEPEWIEAVGFAWLARARLVGAAGNIPSVTGALKQVQLGGVYSGHNKDI